MLEDPSRVIAESLECVSVLFIVILDFDKKAQVLEPTELLGFLNNVRMKVLDPNGIWDCTYTILYL